MRIGICGTHISQTETTEMKFTNKPITHPKRVINLVERQLHYMKMNRVYLAVHGGDFNTGFSDELLEQPINSRGDTYERMRKIIFPFQSTGENPDHRWWAPFTTWQEPKDHLFLSSPFPGIGRLQQEKFDTCYDIPDVAATALFGESIRQYNPSTPQNEKKKSIISTALNMYLNLLFNHKVLKMTLRPGKSICCQSSTGKVNRE